MADQPKSDMVMRFKRKGGSAVYAECALGKDDGDDYMTDFTPQTYDNYSDFFEITKFNFSFDVKDEDESKQKVQDRSNSGAAVKSAAKGGKVRGAFASWRSADDDDKVKYPLEFDKFSFERMIDAASPIFFDACCKSISFESAILVKRTSIDADHLPAGFLQIKFEDVLIVGLNWDDGEMTTETCDFICRKFTLKYRQQTPSGQLGEEVGASWDYLADALPR